jgi:hypothetical protein
MTRAVTPPASIFQGKAASVVQTGVDVTFKPVVSADRRIVGVSLNPVFQTLKDKQTRSISVLNPVIPGAK